MFYLFIIIFAKNQRVFEKTITYYQNELRQNIYKEQLNVYNEIGNNKLNEFYEKFDKLFKEVFNFGLIYKKKF